MGILNEVEESSDTLSGKTFVITGSLPNGMKRPELEKVIKTNGGKAGSSVSKKTNYLIIGESGFEGTSKYTKAVELEIEIIDYYKFMEMI